MRFDRATLDIEWAREYTSSEIESAASRQKADWRVRTGSATAPGHDVTQLFRKAMESLDA